MDTGAAHERIPTQVESGQLSRRQFLQRIGLTGAGLAALPILAACGTSLATPAPSTAPTSGASAAPSSAPAGGASAAPSSRPATAGASTAPSGAASAAPAGSATAIPPTPTAIAGITRTKSSAKVTGKLQILLNADFIPAQTDFNRSEMEEFAKVSGWQYEVTPVAGFQGGGDLKTKLSAQVQSGNAPDLLMHTENARTYQFLNLLEPTTDLVTQLQEQYGQASPAFKNDLFFKGEGANKEEWWAVPYHTRVDGLWIRSDIFKAQGLDPVADVETYEKLRETALKVSNPDQKLWGWGMTANRGGDGEGLVKHVTWRYGSRLQDETGQLVRFDSPETIAGLTFLKETLTDPKWAKMLPPGINAWTDPSNNEAFLAGQLVMTQNGGTMYAKAQLDKVPFAKDIIWRPFPKRLSDGKYLELYSGNRWLMLKGTKNKDASYDLIRHMQSLPIQQKLWQIGLGYSVAAYSNQQSDPILQGNDVAKSALQIAFTPTDWTGIRWPGPPNQAVDTIDSNNSYTDAMAEILQGKPVAEVVKNYHAKFVQIFKDFGLKGA